MRVHLDFETRSVCDLKRSGAMRYAQDPTTQILCAAYALGDGPVNVWRRGDPPPADLIAHVASGGEVCAHNAMFELAIWTYVAGPRLGWGTLSPYQMDCTMARAHTMSLLGSLDKAATLMRVPVKKDQAGYAVMLKMCKPRKALKGEDKLAVYWHDDPVLFERLVEYCEQDVVTEIALDKALPQMSNSEREIYHFDLLVNLRGFKLDVALMRRADKFLDEAKARVDARVRELTDGAVKTSTQVEALKTWLRGRGIPVESISKGEVEDILDHALLFDDDTACDVVKLRRLGAKATSLAKYGAGLRCAGLADSRARGLLIYHKASTGRWAGSLYQPHNLERIDPDKDAALIANMLTILREACSPVDAVDWAELLGYEPMKAIGKCTRAMIVADKDKELIGCDFSNVEGRGAAWLVGERWKIQAFEAYDAGSGPDIYKLAYAGSFGVKPDVVKKPQRQIGKVQELSLGYQGSVGAFMGMGANYDLKPRMLVEPVRSAADPIKWATIADGYDGSNSYGLVRDEWTAIKYIVSGWRQAHPQIVSGWWALQDAVVEAVSDPGEPVFLFDGKVRIYCQRNRHFMYIYLPSGRPLSYFMPRLKTKQDGDRVRTSVIVEGHDSRKNTWGDVQLYGGIIFENIVQALCRDLLAHGIMNCERAGYPCVLHVHDEGVFEVPRGSGAVEEVQRLMSVLPPWAGGFPLASAAWRDERYVK